jgi:hypothetical protein
MISLGCLANVIELLVSIAPSMHDTADLRAHLLDYLFDFLYDHTSLYTLAELIAAFAHISLATLYLLSFQLTAWSALVSAPMMAVPSSLLSLLTQLPGLTYTILPSTPLYLLMTLTAISTSAAPLSDSAWCFIPKPALPIASLYCFCYYPTILFGGDHTNPTPLLLSATIAADLIGSCHLYSPCCTNRNCLWN